MKLLLFSDVHSNIDQCKKLVEMAEAEAVDLVIGAGDFGNLRRGLEKPLDVLKAITQPAILVPGNAESEEELVNAAQIWSSAVVLHGSGTTIAGIEFWGIGGGVPVTPFGDWSYDFTEDQAAKMLADCPQSAVLVSHSPPKGAVDVSSGGQSFGSTAIRDTIQAKKLKLVVCGHIHESAGDVEKIGETPVVNAGPHGMIWEL